MSDNLRHYYSQSCSKLLKIYPGLDTIQCLLIEALLTDLYNP